MAPSVCGCPTRTPAEFRMGRCSRNCTLLITLQVSSLFIPTRESKERHVRNLRSWWQLWQNGWRNLWTFRDRSGRDPVIPRRWVLVPVFPIDQIAGLRGSRAKRRKYHRTCEPWDKKLKPKSGDTTSSVPLLSIRGGQPQKTTYRSLEGWRRCRVSSAL